MQPKSNHILDNKPVGTYRDNNQVFPVLDDSFNPKNSNPNIPFNATQDEWWEYIHEIEEGNFMTLDVFDKKFEKWKKEYFANKL